MYPLSHPRISGRIVRVPRIFVPPFAPLRPNVNNEVDLEAATHVTFERRRVEAARIDARARDLDAKVHGGTNRAWELWRTSIPRMRQEGDGMLEGSGRSTGAAGTVGKNGCFEVKTHDVVCCSRSSQGAAHHTFLCLLRVHLASFLLPTRPFRSPASLRNPSDRPQSIHFVKKSMSASNEASVSRVRSVPSPLH